MLPQFSKSGVSVLLSGGIDSAACLALYLEKKAFVDAIFVDYGQAAAQNEVVAAKGIADHYFVPLKVIRCLGTDPKKAGTITGRNAFLISVALMETQPSLLAIGIHAGTRYWDCSPSFLALAQALADGYTDGRVQVVAPFLTWDKRHIWQFCIERRVPLELTYSCESGGSSPCRTCPSCLDKEALIAG